MFDRALNGTYYYIRTERRKVRYTARRFLFMRMSHILTHLLTYCVHSFMDHL